MTNLADELFGNLNNQPKREVGDTPIGRQLKKFAHQPETPPADLWEPIEPEEPQKEWGGRVAEPSPPPDPEEYKQWEADRATLKQQVTDTLMNAYHEFGCKFITECLDETGLIMYVKNK